MEPIVGSLCFYLAAFLICESARRIVKATVGHGLPRQTLLEFLGALQVCTMGLENGVVFANYGLIAFAVALGISVAFHGLTLEGSFVDSNKLTRGLLRPNQRTVSFLAAQLAGGALAVQLAKQIWRFGLLNDHVKLHATYKCINALNVSFPVGLLCEALATFILNLAIMKIQERYPRYGLFAVPVLIPTVVVVGIASTGMFLNPVVAFSLTYGCNTNVEHFVVYWLGPAIGAYAADLFQERAKIA